MAADINDEIYNRVDTYMQVPYHMNEVNHKVIENGMLDWSDEKQRDRFFVGVLEAHSNSIYSFSYGTANGEYYGARINENGVVEIMRNSAETGGDSWYYSVNEDLTAGDLLVKAGQFDPRTRAWYKAAVEAGGPAFSPLYKHFVMGDLTVSAAWPVYNESGNLDGVLGTHMLLSDIGSFLKDAVEEHNGIAIIIEKESNYLVANSMDVANFAVLQDGTLERYKLGDIDNTDIQNVYEQYKINSTPDNLPLSVIFADINGLKMTNDIFGHTAGDKLIKKSSEILQQVCRQNDVVARVGGDEFIILLPNTTRENADKILTRIKSGFADARVETIKCSIALGLDTKRSPDQSLDQIMANAENGMYKDKTMNRKSINKDVIDTIIETLHTKSPKEKQHSIAVGELCSDVGTALHLPETEISKLKRAGYLHDIGKIVLDEGILTKDIFSDEELEIMQQHPVVGYRILSLFDDTLDLAEYVYGHHERWDGTGYPRRLKGKQIPLLPRIITVVETYHRVLNIGELSLDERKLAALDAIKIDAGTQFDPQIAELFVQILEKSEEV